MANELDTTPDNIISTEDAASEKRGFFGGLDPNVATMRHCADAIRYLTDGTLSLWGGDGSGFVILPRGEESDEFISQLKQHSESAELESLDELANAINRLASKMDKHYPTTGADQFSRMEMLAQIQAGGLSIH